MSAGPLLIFSSAFDCMFGGSEPMMPSRKPHCRSQITLQALWWWTFTVLIQNVSPLKGETRGQELLKVSRGR